MFKNIDIIFKYKIDGKLHSLNCNKSFSNNDLKIELNRDKVNNTEKLNISILPIKEIEIEKLYLVTNFKFEERHRIFVNGYQSWTDSREFFIDEKIKGISSLAKPIIKKYKFDKYGDYTFKKYLKKTGEFHGYTYSYIRDGDMFNLIGSLSEKNGYTIIEEKVKENKIVINKECEGLWISDEYVAFDIVYSKGKEKEVFNTYFDLMNIEAPKCRPMNGWTSWYNYYQNINENIIIENLNNFKEKKKNIDIFQIDDGYQTAVGDWLSVDKDKFPNGMKYIADNIKDKGYKAGIWLAPFVCETNSMIFKEKKDWILKDKNGKLVSSGSNWSGFYALDIYNDEVREYIKNTFSVILNDWGYDMVKLDFLYAVCLIPRRNKTRGTIMTEAMEFIRECVGDKLILGCGVPLGPAFGNVDYCRIGCDIGLDWNDKFFMKLFHRERISTLNAIENSIGRRQLNGRAFLNDPDVFLLRDDNISLTETQKETLSKVNNIFGSLIFTSDNIKNYDDKKHIIFDSIMNLEVKDIKKVERYKEGYVEVLFTENNKKYICIINLGNLCINYNNIFTNIEEVFYDKKNNIIFDKILELKPYESRVFAIMEDENNGEI